MTHRTEKIADATTGDRWEIARRAEQLRAAETRRLIGALARRVSAAFTGAAPRHPAIEPVTFPRAPSSAIF